MIQPLFLAIVWTSQTISNINIANQILPNLICFTSFILIYNYTFETTLTPFLPAIMILVTSFVNKAVPITPSMLFK
jgi:hypothetical protein